MWSPAVTLLQEAQFPVRYAAPKEGFRGWGGGNAILTHVTGSKLDAAYDYLNWWNTPVPAGLNGDAGLLNANIAAAHNGSRHEQGARWHVGRQLLAQGQGGHDAARRPRRQARASRSAPSGTAAPTRSRSGRFYAWNSQGVNRDYLLQKWQEFITA